MRLLQLFEQLDRLDEAAIDRYMQMFEGIIALLDQITSAKPVVSKAIADIQAKYEPVFNEVREAIVAAHMEVQPGSDPRSVRYEVAKWDAKTLWQVLNNGAPSLYVKEFPAAIRSELRLKMIEASTEMKAARDREPEVKKVSDNVKAMKVTVQAQVKGAGFSRSTVHQ